MFTNIFTAIGVISSVLSIISFFFNTEKYPLNKKIKIFSLCVLIFVLGIFMEGKKGEVLKQQTLPVIKHNDNTPINNKINDIVTEFQRGFIAIYCDNYFYFSDYEKGQLIKKKTLEDDGAIIANDIYPFLYFFTNGKELYYIKKLNDNYALCKKDLQKYNENIIFERNVENGLNPIHINDEYVFFTSVYDGYINIERYDFITQTFTNIAENINGFTYFTDEGCYFGRDKEGNSSVHTLYYKKYNDKEIVLLDEYSYIVGKDNKIYASSNGILFEINNNQDVIEKCNVNGHFKLTKNMLFEIDEDNIVYASYFGSDKKMVRSVGEFTTFTPSKETDNIYFFAGNDLIEVGLSGEKIVESIKSEPSFVSEIEKNYAFYFYYDIIENGERELKSDFIKIY